MNLAQQDGENEIPDHIAVVLRLPQVTFLCCLEEQGVCLKGVRSGEWHIFSNHIVIDQLFGQPVSHLPSGLPFL